MTNGCISWFISSLNLTRLSLMRNRGPLSFKNIVQLVKFELPLAKPSSGCKNNSRAEANGKLVCSLQQVLAKQERVTERPMKRHR